MNLKQKRFHDVDAAREWLEQQRWPSGPVCPHCGNVDQTRIKSLKGKAHRPGLYMCNECREQFTVTVGSVMHRSKLPLTTWVQAIHIMASSKKGMSAHQLHRMLGIKYESAWFVFHRLREAMRIEPGSVPPIGGEGRRSRRTKPISASTTRRASVGRSATILSPRAAKPARRTSAGSSPWSSAVVKAACSIWPTPMPTTFARSS